MGINFSDYYGESCPLLGMATKDDLAEALISARAENEKLKAENGGLRCDVERLQYVENGKLRAENAQLKAEIDDRHRALLYAHTSTSDLYAALRARVAELEAELKMAVYCCVTEAQMSKLVADQIKKYNEEHPE